MDLTLDPRLIDDKVEELPFEFESYEDEVAFKSELREWHEAYGSIYTVEINEINFFFRHLTKKEMAVGQEIYTDDFERTEYICKTCVISPEIEDYSLEIFAGIPEILCRLILKESGYTDAQTIKLMIAKWENVVSEVENQLPLVIKEAFHDLSLEEIESWPMSKITEYYVKGKWILENLRGLRLVSEEEMAQEQ